MRYHSDYTVGESLPSLYNTIRSRFHAAILVSFVEQVEKDMRKSAIVYDPFNLRHTLEGHPENL